MEPEPFLFQVMEPIRYKEPLSESSRINNTIQEMFYSVVISFADCLKNLTNIIEQSEVAIISPTSGEWIIFRRKILKFA